MIITVPFFAIAFLLLVVCTSPVRLSTSPTEYQSDWSSSSPVMTGTGASLPPVSFRREYFEVRILKNEKIQVLLMKLFCILIYDRGIQRLWTNKNDLCVLK